MKTDWRAGVVLIAIVTAINTANAAKLHLPLACTKLISKSMSGWRPMEPTGEVANWASKRGLNPIVTAGDFDGNGSTDWAALRTFKGKQKLAVCMYSKSSIKLLVIDDPYCSDMLFLARAGSKHYNYETGQPELINNDGVSVSCFERAGATYVYMHGNFRRIVDSD